ncbi:MAG: phosphoenolpyruvate--protein phosphotransferase [Clostridia bacterium]|nr:phosphoenolpyruvate--protein phosphotransferase [Clostridia bacterium]
MNKLKGIGVSSGYDKGVAVLVTEAVVDVTSEVFQGADIEKQRLGDAVAEFTKETQALIESLTKSAGAKNAEILEGHLMMLNDPYMLSQMNERIDGGETASQAVDGVCTMFFDMFSGVPDELMQQRASDVKDIKVSLLEILSGARGVKIEDVPSGSILIAKDFTPSMTSRINRENVAGIIAEVGSVTSHSAILARALDIPAVLSLTDAMTVIKDGDVLAIDGVKGYVYQDPDEVTLSEIQKLHDDYLEEKASLMDYFGKESVTKSGSKRAVFCNIGKPEDANNVNQNSGEGIGLFRTEFLFMDRPAVPTEEEQFEAYSTVAKSMAGKEVIIRTLDVGGDKEIPYIDIPKEDNPFLGLRAVRYCLQNEKLYKVQLKALIRAAVYGEIKIMVPLVTDIEELRAVKALIKECEAELEAAGTPFKKDVPVGVMIETPAAVFIADDLAKEAAFFSIGTNDLTGYTMAVDRGNAAVANLYSVHKPAVLKAIELTIKAAKNAGIPVGMCGEAAADKDFIPSLVEWGLDEFSVTPNSVLRTRKAICECD